MVEEVRGHPLKMTLIKAAENKTNHIATTKIVISMDKVSTPPIVIIVIKIVARTTMCKEVLAVASASQITIP